MRAESEPNPAPPPGPAARGGFWTFARLTARNAAHKAATGCDIISGFDPNDDSRRERASYNLSVGNEIYISPVSEEGGTSRELLEPREARAIPPGQFAFLHTAEEVWIPDDAIGFIALRSKAAKFRGLVNVSGFYVEPGYRGNLVFAVFNAGPAAIHVARDDKWFEIFFADLDSETAPFRPKGTFKGVPTELITPLSDRFHSLPGLEHKIDETRDELDERLQKVEREHSILRWSMALILGALIAFGARSCGDAREPKATIAAATAEQGDGQ